jgi:hypothetical protein
VVLFITKNSGPRSSLSRREPAVPTATCSFEADWSRPCLASQSRESRAVAGRRPDLSRAFALEL